LSAPHVDDRSGQGLAVGPAGDAAMAGILASVQPAGRGLRHLCAAVTERLAGRGYRCETFQAGRTEAGRLRATHLRTGRVYGVAVHCPEIGKMAQGSDRTLLHCVRQAREAAGDGESVVACWGRFAPYRLGTTLVVGVRGWKA